MPRFASDSGVLHSMLQLEQAPVAVQARRDVPQRLTRASADPTAVHLSTARFERQVFDADGANMTPCPVGRYSLGQWEAFPSLLGGSFRAGHFPGAGLAVFGNAEAVRQMLAQTAIMPGGQSASFRYQAEVTPTPLTGTALRRLYRRMFDDDGGP